MLGTPLVEEPGLDRRLRIEALQANNLFKLSSFLQELPGSLFIRSLKLCVGPIGSPADFLFGPALHLVHFPFDSVLGTRFHWFSPSCGFCLYFRCTAAAGRRYLPPVSPAHPPLPQG